jgi:hypothetical protein
MTPTARFPDLFRPALPARPVLRARFAALVLAAAAFAAAVVLAGCSQEGKTVQNALPVPGIAYDVTKYTARNDTIIVNGVATDTFTTVVMDVRLKVQTVYRNGCEARGGLELRLIGADTSRVYVVSPVARYTADEDCNVGASGDTLQTITLKDLTVVRKLTAGIPGDYVFARMQVEGADAPPFEFDIRHDLATPGSDSTLYDIEVEDATSGLPIDGALVTVQQHGTPNNIGDGVTSGGGKFQFSVAYGVLAGTPGDSYIVKVSYAGRITLFRAIDFPSLSKRREAIVVRV